MLFSFHFVHFRTVEYAQSARLSIKLYIEMLKCYLSLDIDNIFNTLKETRRML